MKKNTFEYFTDVEMKDLMGHDASKDNLSSSLETLSPQPINPSICSLHSHESSIQMPLPPIMFHTILEGDDTLSE